MRLMEVPLDILPSLAIRVEAKGALPRTSMAGLIIKMSLKNVER